MAPLTDILLRKFGFKLLLDPGLDNNCDLLTNDFITYSSKYCCTWGFKPVPEKYFSIRHLSHLRNILTIRHSFFLTAQETEICNAASI